MYAPINLNFATQVFVVQRIRQEMLKNRGLYFEKTFGMLSDSQSDKSLIAVKVMLIILSGDVEVQPGPTDKTAQTLAFPCTMCNTEVGDDDWAIECDNCNKWTHVKCSDITEGEYRDLQKQSSFVWYCPVCNIKSDPPAPVPAFPCTMCRS